MPAEKTLKGVVFTINNPPDEIDLWKEDRMDYLVYQIEEGESGTRHVQGYVEFKKRTRFSAVKKLLGAAAHIEARRGTATEARDYCMKEDTRIEGPWQFGEFKEISQGQRNDLQALAAAARSGKSCREVFEEMPEVYLRHHRAYDRVRCFYRPERRPREVYILLGPPDAGKTRYVFDKFPDFYQVPVDPRGFWMDGYDGQDVVLIDDYSGQWPLKVLYQILHEYPVQVPVKGSYVWWNPSVIYITTNEPWQDWYQTDEKHKANYLHAMGRRITDVIVLPPREE